MDEEGADFRGVGRGVEEAVVAAGAMVAAEGRFAAGPAAAGYQAADGDEVRWIFKRFDGEVGLIGDELGIKAEPGADGLVDLGGGIVVGLQAADGSLDERAEVGDVAGRGRRRESVIMLLSLMSKW